MESSFAVNMLAIDHGRPSCCRSSKRTRPTSTTAAKSFCAARASSSQSRGPRRNARRLPDRAGEPGRIHSDHSRLSQPRRSAGQTARVRIYPQSGGKNRHPDPERSAANRGRYAFSEHQANQILDLRLYQLTGLEPKRSRLNTSELIDTIKDLRDILAKESRVFQIIKKELREIAKVRCAADDGARSGRRRDQHGGSDRQ